MITLLKSLLRLDFLWMMIMALNLMVEKPSNLRACKTLRNDGDYKLAYVRMLLCEHERIGGVWLGVCISNLTMIFTVFLLRSHYLLKSLYDHWKLMSMHLKKKQENKQIPWIYKTINAIQNYNIIIENQDNARTHKVRPIQANMEKIIEDIQYD